jgi:hypothetical protein
MPSGYTSKLYDLKEVSFQDFVADCASAFMIESREGGWKGLPESISNEWIEHYVEKLADAINKSQELESVSYEEMSERNEEAFVKDMEYWESATKRTASVMLAYSNMLEQVMAWEPPTPRHQCLKDFMVEQLRNSIDFDNDASTMPKQKSTEQFIAEARQKAKRDVEYYQEQLEKARESHAQRTQWLNDLKRSIGL